MTKPEVLRELDKLSQRKPGDGDPVCQWRGDKDYLGASNTLAKAALVGDRRSATIRQFLPVMPPC